MRKITISIISIVVLAVCLLAFFGCNEKGDENRINYSADNDYEYEVVEDESFVTYAPKGVTAEYGFLFYLGTMIAPECYEYLASALAKQGYLVVISTNLFAFLQYDEEEPTFATYPDVKFFIGGHSQGGGAGIRRTVENADKVAGVVLLAPLTFDGYSLVDSDLPVLLLEAENDGVLSATMKAEAKERLPESREEHMLAGCHMSFSTNDNDTMLGFFNDGPVDETVKAEQKVKTTEYVLAFLKRVTSSK